MLAELINDETAAPNTRGSATALAFLSQKPNKEGIISRLRNSFNINDIIAIERTRLILWGPVVFGFGAAAGCGVFAGSKLTDIFAIALFLLALYFVAALVAKRLDKRIIAPIKIVILAILIFQAGIMIALLRIEAVHAPVFTSQIANPIQISGEIIDIDKSYSGNWRAKIKIESFQNLAKDKSPKYIRLSIRELKADQIGAKINCLAELQTPPPPIIPGGYNFARKAYFSQIGAVGFCKSKPAFSQTADISSIDEFRNFVTRQRLQTSALLADHKVGGGGGFLAAVFTGDRSWMSNEDTNALQISGLHHIVSVSGMHITLIAGIVFLTFSKILALIAPLALRFDVRKIAGTLSILIATLYTIFSGAEAPAVRALMMCFVVFGAILLNRRAISMRGLAIAALLLLLIRPENAIDAGFQMSFLATMALVALWESYEIGIKKPRLNILRTGLVWLIGALMASFVAGLATMPIAVHNFGAITTYALIANLLATPISDFLVAPFSLLGVLFSLFGFSEPFFNVASWGLDLILKISYYFANAPFASIKTNPLNEAATFFLVFCALWLCLWKTNFRYLAVLPLMIGLFVWVTTSKPVLLVSPEGRAFLNISDGNLKICFLRGAKFDARRLISASHLNQSQKDILIAQLDYPNFRKCRASEGDFEAHFISPKDENANKSMVRQAAIATPVLSLTFNNKSYALDAKTAPFGAVLVRDDGILHLHKQIKSSAPWLLKANSNQ